MLPKCDFSLYDSLVGGGKGLTRHGDLPTSEANLTVREVQHSL